VNGDEILKCGLRTRRNDIERGQQHCQAQD
jgi:hypothetical protein